MCHTMACRINKLISYFNVIVVDYKIQNNNEKLLSLLNVPILLLKIIK